MVTMNRNKVVIVGTGRVGATAAFGIVTHGLCNELVLIDCSAAKALGEARDLDDGSEFQDRHVKVRAGDYADCKDADIVVITVAASRRPTPTAWPNSASPWVLWAKWSTTSWPPVLTA